MFSFNPPAQQNQNQNQNQNQQQQPNQFGNVGGNTSSPFTLNHLQSNNQNQNQYPQQQQQPNNPNSGFQPQQQQQPQSSFGGFVQQPTSNFGAATSNNNNFGWNQQQQQQQPNPQWQQQQQQPNQNPQFSNQFQPQPQSTNNLAWGSSPAAASNLNHLQQSSSNQQQLGNESQNQMIYVPGYLSKMRSSRVSGMQGEGKEKGEQEGGKRWRPYPSFPSSLFIADWIYALYNLIPSNDISPTRLPLDLVTLIHLLTLEMEQITLNFPPLETLWMETPL